MSAPLVLSADDLRNLADGLAAISRVRRQYGVGPADYDPQITITAGAGDVTLHVRWVEYTDAPGAYVIDDRYGS